MSDYLNLHILYTLTSANPNRDDVGSPKAVFVGGTERARISSQAMTRAKRLRYENSGIGEKSYRSALLAADVTARTVDLVTQAGGTMSAKDTAALTRRVAKAVNSLVMNEKKAAEKADADAKAAADTAGNQPQNADESDADVKKDTLVYLAEAEIGRLASIEAEAILSGQDVEFTPDDFIEAGRTASLSIAAFGRMFANRPDLHNEAAVQRADAFGTSPLTIDLDFFTAVDDLRAHGAGHMGRKMKTSTTYYWHANVNRDELLATWIAPDGDGEAKARLTEFFLALFLALPTGGQNTSAHHTTPALVLPVAASSPWSYSPAFNQPISAHDGTEDGEETESIKRLLAYHDDSVCLLGDLYTPSPMRHAQIGGDNGQTLPSLAAECADWVLQGRAG